MNLEQNLLVLLDNTLHLEGRGLQFKEHTALLGAVPELDSMGVVSLLTALEERLGIAIEDDEIDGSVFQTFGTLHAFVRSKLAG